MTDAPAGCSIVPTGPIDAIRSPMITTSVAGVGAPPRPSIRVAPLSTVHGASTPPPAGWCIPEQYTELPVSWRCDASKEARMGDEPLIDTHVHFFDRAEPGLEWSWLRTGYSFRKWTATESVDRPRYSVAEFTDDAVGAHVAGVVHGHSADPIDDPAVETAWLERLGDEQGTIIGIVGRCALAAPDAPALIARHAAHARFRGVRDPGAGRHLDPGAVGAAMQACADAGASVELRRDHRQFEALCALAGQWPDVTVALTHACLPLERTPEQLR